jgi:hypothetical protein
MLDIANCVAMGRPWHGRKVRQGLVVVLVAEGLRGVKRRQRAWERRFNNGEVVPADQLMFIPFAVQIKDHRGWAVMRDALARLGPVLIILDTQARITVGVAENDATEMGEVVERVEALRRRTGACVALVHHLGHTGDQGRGSSAVNGAINTELRVVKDAGQLHLFNDKQKDGPEEVPLVFNLEPEGDSVVVVPVGGEEAATDPFESTTVAKHPTDRVLDILTRIFPHRGATKAQLGKMVQTHDRDSKTGKPMSVSTFYRAWDKLEHTEQILRIRGTQKFVVKSDSTASLSGDAA